MGSSRWSPLLLATFTLALSTAARSQTTFDTYRLTRIGEETFGVFDPFVEDINEKGEMVAATREFPEPQRALLLRDGMVIELGDLMGGASPQTFPTAINDLTQITGFSDVQDASGNRVNRAFIWDAGQIRDLGIEPGASASDINNRGQIVGFSVESSRARPFLWEDGRTTFLELLPCPNNPNGIARAINENGVIVGTSAAPVGIRAVMWRNGEVMVLEPTFPLQQGEAVDVNDRGDAIGTYLNTVGAQNHTAFVWDAGGEVSVLLPLELPGANAAEGASINNQGQIVGHTHLGSGASVATLWQEGVARDLNELISDDDPAKAFVTLEFGIKINDAGLIVANGRDSREPDAVVSTHYLLTPTGTPASSASTPPPAALSPPPGDNGGGAVNLVSLLLLLFALSFGRSCARRRQRAPVARPYD